MNELLQKYYRKIRLEALIKSAIFGLIIGLCSTLIISIISLSIKDNLLWVAIGGGMATAIIASVISYFLIYRPSLKDAALRVDQQLHLDERVITMLEFSDNNSFIAQAQRDNAKTELKKVQYQQIKFNFLKVPLIIFSVILILSTSMLTISTINAKSTENKQINNGGIIDIPNDSNNDAEIIEKLIERLRTIINTSKVSDEFKAKLHDVVDDMEIDLVQYDTTIEKIARIRETQELIRQLIREELAKQEEEKITIGEALQEFVTTYQLGVAIESEKPENIDGAFEYMYERLEILFGFSLIKELIRTADDIEEALRTATEVDEDMEEALQALADAYREAAMKLITIGGDEPLPIGFDEALEEIEQKIKDAMSGNEEDKSDLEELEEEIEDALEDALEDLGGEEFKKPKDSSEEIKDESEYNPKDDEGELGSDKVIDGLTDYIDIFPESQEQALNLIASGILPEDIALQIAKYFGILNPNN